MVGGLALGFVGAFFLFIVAYLVSTEIMPVRGGSLKVETNAMILNVLWEGNEIYILLSAYVLAAAGCTYGGIRLLTKAFRN